MNKEQQITTETGKEWVALVGNPNSGKTAIFNLLTGLNQKVSNYPGVTVERKMGNGNILGTDMRFLDLPGTYSITPESFDERIVAQEVLNWIHGAEAPSVIISVVDASNLSRNLYLTSQIMDLGIPVVIALNMMDRVIRHNQTLDAEALKRILGVADVVPTSATEKWGLDDLRTAIFRARNTKNDHQGITLPQEILPVLEPLISFFEDQLDYSPRIARSQSLRLVARESVLDLYSAPVFNGSRLEPTMLKELVTIRNQAARELDDQKIPRRTLEAMVRYDWLDKLLKTENLHSPQVLDAPSRSERADRILTHTLLGPVIFFLLLYGIFQSIFSWAIIPMNWIDSSIMSLGEFIVKTVPPGMLKDLLVEGVVAGVGAILVFLPQILILVFFLTLLEDSGYMARVALLSDKFMTKVGLHGRSVLPLMSGYACAIPGIMATRTIDSWKERLVTILILPLMSCSARLPIYALMIGAFIPSRKVLNLINLQGLTMILMYLLGTVTAILLAKLFSRFISIKEKSSFVMELPPYRLPLLRSVIRQVYLRGKLFVLNAGKIIMAISVVLWFLASYPKTNDGMSSQSSIHTSYAGQIGHAIEPLIKPLGFDWKIGVGLITSFAAREVVVSTLATLYNVEGESEEVIRLSDALRNDQDPETGRPLYSPLVALSLMVFYVYAAQCMATFAIVRNETNSWRWPLFMIAYMTSLAYLASFLVYQGGLLLGYT